MTKNCSNQNDTIIKDVTSTTKFNDVSSKTTTISTTSTTSTTTATTSSTTAKTKAKKPIKFRFSVKKLASQSPTESSGIIGCITSNLSSSTSSNSCLSTTTTTSAPSNTLTLLPSLNSSISSKQRSIDLTESPLLNSLKRKSSVNSSRSDTVSGNCNVTITGIKRSYSNKNNSNSNNSNSNSNGNSGNLNQCGDIDKNDCGSISSEPPKKKIKLILPRRSLGSTSASPMTLTRTTSNNSNVSSVSNNSNSATQFSFSGLRTTSTVVTNQSAIVGNANSDPVSGAIAGAISDAVSDSNPNTRMNINGRKTESFEEILNENGLQPPVLEMETPQIMRRRNLRMNDDDEFSVVNGKESNEEKQDRLRNKIAIEFNDICVGYVLFVLDGKVWRRSRVISRIKNDNKNINIIKIHYLGWSSKFDETFDLNNKSIFYRLKLILPKEFYCEATYICDVISNADCKGNPKDKNNENNENKDNDKDNECSKKTKKKTINIHNCPFGRYWKNQNQNKNKNSDEGGAIKQDCECCCKYNNDHFSIDDAILEGNDLKIFRHASNLIRLEHESFLQFKKLRNKNENVWKTNDKDKDTDSDIDNNNNNNSGDSDRNDRNDIMNIEDIRQCLSNVKLKQEGTFELVRERLLNMIDEILLINFACSPIIVNMKYILDYHDFQWLLFNFDHFNSLKYGKILFKNETNNNDNCHDSVVVNNVNATDHCPLCDSSMHNQLDCPLQLLQY